MMLVLSRRLVCGLLALALVLLLAPGRGQAQLMTFPEWYTLANACANNRVALVIPCHRVIREDGKLGGYRWGVERKEKLLAAEKGK